MNGNSLGVVLSPGVRLSRNGAKASLLASRSEVQLQPKTAPCLARRRDLIPRSWPRPSVVRFPWSTRSAFSKRLMLPLPLRVELEHCFAEKVCIPRTW